MRTWPRILMLLSCVSIVRISTQQVVTAQEAECPERFFSDTFQMTWRGPTRKDLYAS